MLVPADKTAIERSPNLVRVVTLKYGKQSMVMNVSWISCPGFRSGEPQWKLTDKIFSFQAGLLATLINMKVRNIDG